MPYDPVIPYAYGSPAQFSPSFQTKFYDNSQAPVDLTQVNGIEGAKAFPTKPNSRYALFDMNEDIMYIKQTDAGNFPTITEYEYTKRITEPNSQRYVTIEEFERFKEEVLNAKQFGGTEQERSNERSTTNKKYDANAKRE